MDRKRARARVLIAAPLTLALAALADAPALPIAESRWLAPGTVFEGLTRAPPECLKPPVSVAEAQSVAMGRAAFGAPLLLGGQAARAGLSCASCHRNGRDNPAFGFPGLSGTPGTADVTSSLMSSRRGDGSFNPKPIPDLAAPGRLASKAHGNEELERFIRGLIVEEFDGPEPPPALLRGLADYVRAMNLGACPPARSVAVSLGSAAAEVDAAIEASLIAAGKGDADSLRLLLAAARSALGRIDERHRLSGMEEERERLRLADRALQDARALPPAAAAKALSRWKRDWRGTLALLKRKESRSLFAPAMLRAQLPN